MAKTKFDGPYILNLPDGNEYGFELVFPPECRLFSLVLDQVSGTETDCVLKLFARKEAVVPLRGSYVWDPAKDGSEDNYLVIEPQTRVAGSSLRLFSIDAVYANADVPQQHRIYVSLQASGLLAPASYALSFQLILPYV